MTDHDGALSQMSEIRSEHPCSVLDEQTADRLLAGRVQPDDAPPPYASVARLIEAVNVPARADELEGEKAAVAMFIRQRDEVTALVGSDGIGKSRRRPRRVAVLALTGTLALVGVVASGSLPVAAHTVVKVVLGPPISDPPAATEPPAGPVYDESTAPAEPALAEETAPAGPVQDEGTTVAESTEGEDANHGQGEQVSTLAHDPTLEGREKGAAVCTLASAGACQAGRLDTQRPAKPGSAVSVPNPHGH